MDKQIPQKQPHEVVLDKLAVLKGGNYYTGMHCEFGFLEIQSICPGLIINGAQITTAAQMKHFGSSAREFILKAAEVLRPLNARIAFYVHDEKAFDLRARLEVVFKEFLEILALTGPYTLEMLEQFERRNQYRAKDPYKGRLFI